MSYAEEIAQTIKVENMKKNIMQKLNSEQKEKFENAILEYDYLQNEGVILRTREELITSCYGEEYVNKELKKALAEYIIELNKIYYGNQLLWNDNSVELSKTILLIGQYEQEFEKK